MEVRLKKAITWLVVLGGGIAVVLIALRLIGFEISKYPPDRPANIPSDTEWAGGYDGGVWIKCSEVNGSDPQQFKCDIYGENGSCWLSQGSFQPFKVTWDKNSNSAIFDETRLNKLDYSAWDGRSLHLQNGFTLKWLGQWTPVPSP